MIYEYAIDPKCLSEFNTFWQALNQFGIHHGRVLCTCPKKWLRDVRKAIYDAAGDDYVERDKMIDRVEELQHSGWLITRALSKPDDSANSWIERILPEHRRMPFHGIICNGSENDVDCILTKYDLNDKNSNWYVDPTPQVTRTATDIAFAFAPLGRLSSDLLIIDPYFGEKPHNFSSIPEIVQASHCTERPLKRVEIHTVSNRKGGIAATKKSVRHALSVEFRASLPAELPIRVSIWECKEKGDVFHDRYLLTDLGGVGITVGLDVGQEDVRSNEDTTMFRLGRELYERRKAQFDRSSTLHWEEYKFIDDIIVENR